MQLRISRRYGLAALLAFALALTAAPAAPVPSTKDDKKPGDVEGDNRNNVWHVVAP